MPPYILHRFFDLLIEGHSKVYRRCIEGDMGQVVMRYKCFIIKKLRFFELPKQSNIACFSVSSSIGKKRRLTYKYKRREAAIFLYMCHSRNF